MDISIVNPLLKQWPGIDNSVNFKDIAEIANKTGKNILKDVNLFNVYENEEKLGKGKKSYAVSFIFQDPSKTLKDKEIEKIMNKLRDENSPSSHRRKCLTSNSESANLKPHRSRPAFLRSHDSGSRLNRCPYGLVR